MRFVDCCGLVVILVAGCGRASFDLRSDAVDGNDAPICPNGYTLVQGGCYRFVVNMVELPWRDAELACEADGPAHLIVIDNDAEMILASAALSIASDGWIGASDRVTEASYLTVTGAPAYTTWGPSEPTGANEDCLQVFNTGGIGDRLCDDLNDYMCEYDGILAVPSAF